MPPPSLEEVLPEFHRLRKQLAAVSRVFKPEVAAIAQAAAADFAAAVATREEELEYVKTELLEANGGLNLPWVIRALAFRRSKCCIGVGRQGCICCMMHILNIALDAVRHINCRSG